MLSLRRLCMLLSGRCRFASTNLSTWYPALGHHCAVSSAAASRAATAAAAAVTPTTVTLTSCHASSQLLKAGQRLHTATSYCANSAAAGAVGQLLPPLPGMSQLEPLSLEETLQAVAVPPIERNLGPRVEHIYVSTPGTLSEVIATALQLPQWFVLELIRFGAVHHCPVMPQPSPKAAPRMSPEHLQRMQALRAAGIAKHGKSPALGVPRRAAADCTIDEGSYVRVHVHPKRFPAAYSVDWRQCVLADRPEYVVVDKPAGVQVPPTVDNMLENVVSLTAAALGLPPDALLNTHRLDVGTSGVVLMAKSPGFAAWFSALLKNKPGALVKTYRCLTSTPPPLGPMVHWAVVEHRAAGEPAHTRMLLECSVPDPQQGSSSSSGGDDDGGCGGKDAGACSGSGLGAGGSSSQRSVGAAQGAVEGAARCELIVEQVQQVSLTGRAAQEWGPVAYETTLQLVTGRTHQIRAQMAAVGSPLLGDQLYTALAARWRQEQQQEQAQQEHVQQQPVKQGQGQQQPGQQQGQKDQQDQQQCQQQGQKDQQEHQPQQQQQQQESVQDGVQHRHSGAQWSKVYQEDPSRPIGLQAARLRVRNVGRRMTGDGVTNGAAAAAGGTEEVQQQAGEGAGGSGRGCGPEWVEFEAGPPWWRA